MSLRNGCTFLLRNFFLLALTTILAVSSLNAPAYAEARTFSDKDSIPTWAAIPVQNLTESQILNGYPEGRFAPDDPVTFEQVIIGIYRVFAQGKEAEKLAATNPKLSNVSPWAQGYVQLALQNKLLRSIAKNSPVPAPVNYMEPASRVWTAALLTYALGYNQWSWDPATTIPFADIANVTVDLRMMVHSAVALGIASGNGDLKFNPEGTLTRAEFAVMLHNAKRVAETKKSVRSYFPATPPQQTVVPLSMGFFQRGTGIYGNIINQALTADLTQHSSQIKYLNMMSYAMKDTGEVFNADKTWGDHMFEDTVNLAHKNGVKTLLVLQNFDMNKFRSDFAAKVLKDPALQQQLIDWLVQEIQSNGDSGVNIDFENVYTADRTHFSEFVEKVTAEMQKHGWVTIVSVMTKTNDLTEMLFLDYDRLGRTADYVSLMTYDNYNPLNTEPGPQYDLNYLDKVLKFSLAAVPSGKLQIGIGNHNWVWNDSGRNQLTLHELDQMLATGIATAYWDEAKQAPYAKYRDVKGNESTVYYQDARTYKAQFDWVKKNNLGGFVLFPLGWETDSLWQTLSESLPTLQK